MIRWRALLKGIAALAAAAAIAVPVGFVVTLMLLPLWRWLESVHGIESIGHSGPADWCYLLVTVLVFSLLVLVFSRLASHMRLLPTKRQRLS